MQRDLKQLDEQILELMKERVAKTNSEHVSEIEQLTKQLDLIASTVSYKLRLHLPHSLAIKVSVVRSLNRLVRTSFQRM